MSRVGCGRSGLWRKQFPVPLGDHLNGSVDHFDGGLVVNCVRGAVGMQRALHSAIGLPRRSMSASWMLGFLMPAEVRRYFTIPLLAVVRPQSMVPVQLRTYNR